MTYVYFIDEIFLPQKPLLEALVARPVRFGIQTRIDLWKPDMLDLLGAGRLRVDRGGRREPHGGRPRRARQGLPRLHRRPRRAADPRAALRALRPGQPHQGGGRRPRARRGMARAPAPARRLGQRSRAALSLPEFAGLPDASGASRTTAPGSARTSTISASSTSFSDIQEDRPLPLPDLEAACGCS